LKKKGSLLENRGDLRISSKRGVKKHPFGERDANKGGGYSQEYHLGLEKEYEGKGLKKGPV